MEAKTKKVLFYVAVGLIVAAAVIFGIVELNGGAEEAAPVVEEVVAEEVVAVDSAAEVPADTVVMDTVVEEVAE